MTTISLKLPEGLASRLEAEARKRQTSKSQLLRDALMEKLLQRKENFTSCADLAGDLAGFFHGPRDLSTNKKYLDEAVLREFCRERKRHR